MSHFQLAPNSSINLDYSKILFIGANAANIIIGCVGKEIDLIHAFLAINPERLLCQVEIFTTVSQNQVTTKMETTASKNALMIC